MSILIKGMEMPTCCGMCPLIDYETLECRCGGIRDKNCYDGIYDGCPLVPVPPHGRLIDADALRAEFTEPNEGNGGWRNPDEALVHKTGVWAAIDAAPTIIPAEEGE